MRQYGMNMSGPLNKMLPTPEENPGVNKLSSSVQKKMGYTEDSSGDPLMKLPTFNTSEQVGRVDPSAIGQPMDYSDVLTLELLLLRLKTLLMLKTQMKTLKE